MRIHARFRWCLLLLLLWWCSDTSAFLLDRETRALATLEPVNGETSSKSFFPFGNSQNPFSTSPKPEVELRDEMLSRARNLARRGDLTFLFGFFPPLAQTYVLGLDWGNFILSQSLEQDFSVIMSTIALPGFPLVLLGIKISQLMKDKVLTVRGTSTTQSVPVKDPFGLELILNNPDFLYQDVSQPKGTKVSKQQVDLVLLLRTIPTKVFVNGGESFYLSYKGQKLADPTKNFVLAFSTFSVVASLAALAPYMYYVYLLLTANVSPSTLAQANLQLAASQFAIAAIGVGILLASLSKSDSVIKDAFTEEKDAGYLASKTILLLKKDE